MGPQEKKSGNGTKHLLNGPPERPMCQEMRNSGMEMGK